jgi:DNA-binding transcriptional LysR family regulator
MMAIEGIGFCCLPNWVIASSIATGKLVKVMDDPFARCETIYALRPFQKANAKVSLFMESIEASLTTVAEIVSS